MTRFFLRHPVTTWMIFSAFGQLILLPDLKMKTPFLPFWNVKSGSVMN